MCFLVNDDDDDDDDNGVWYTCLSEANDDTWWLGDTDGHVHCQNKKSGETIFTEKCHANAITALKSINGKLLLTTSLDGSLKMWKYERENFSNDREDVDKKKGLFLFYQTAEFCGNGGFAPFSAMATLGTIDNLSGQTILLGDSRGQAYLLSLKEIAS